MNYTYIVRCSDGSLYTGWTTNINHRVSTHNSGKGAKYTRGRLPVELIYYEEHIDKGSALKREYQIKQLSHNEKLKLIEERVFFDKDK